MRTDSHKVIRPSASAKYKLILQQVAQNKVYYFKYTVFWVGTYVIFKHSCSDSYVLWYTLMKRFVVEEKSIAIFVENHIMFFW